MTVLNDANSCQFVYVRVVGRYDQKKMSDDCESMAILDSCELKGIVAPRFASIVSCDWKGRMQLGE
jgi:hypothetical protein